MAKVRTYFLLELELNDLKYKSVNRFANAAFVCGGVPCADYRTHLDTCVPFENVFFTTRGNLSLGGFGYQNDKGISFIGEHYPFMTTFQGLMDDFRVVARPFVLKLFDVFNGKECLKNDESSYKLVDINKFRQCERKCKRNTSCQGYELNKANTTCYHFNKYPSVVQSNEETTRCVLKVTTLE